MFLNMLSKKEGRNFIELAAHAMTINGTIKESEEAVFDVFKLETGLADYDITNKDYTDIIREFQASTKKVKKAVIIETAGILDADDEVDAEEEKWINKLGDDLGFRESEIRKMIRWVEDFNDLLQEGYNYINIR